MNYIGYFIVLLFGQPLEYQFVVTTDTLEKCEEYVERQVKVIEEPILEYGCKL